MKVAANVIAILAWGGFLAALWYPLLAGTAPRLGLWLTVVIVSFLVGVIVPPFLFGVEAKASVRLPSSAERAETARRARGE